MVGMLAMLIICLNDLYDKMIKHDQKQNGTEAQFKQGRGSRQLVQLRLGSPSNEDCDEDGGDFQDRAKILATTTATPATMARLVVQAMVARKMRMKGDVDAQRKRDGQFLGR